MTVRSRRLGRECRWAPLLLPLLGAWGASVLVACGGSGEAEASAAAASDRVASPGATDGTLWVLSRADREVSVIDPGTARVIGRVGLGFRSDPSDLVHWEGSVWVGSSGGMLQRIDASTRSLEETVPLDVDLWSVSASDHGIYGVDAELGIVTRHDPRTGALVAELGSSERVGAMAAAPAGTLAVLADMQQVHFYAPGATEPTVFPTELGPGDTAVGFGSVWLYQNDGRLFRLDPTSGQVRAGIDTPEAYDAHGIAIGSEAVWITSLERQEVLRVDPATDRVAQRIPVAGVPEHVAELGGMLWVLFPEDDAVVQIDPTSGEETARIEVYWPLRIIAVP